MGSISINYFIIRLSILSIFILVIASLVSGQSNEDCMMCHEDPELTTERDGKTHLCL